MLEHKGKTKLQSAILTAVDSFFRTSPYAAAGLLCGVKASAADFIAQRRQFHKRGSEDAEIQMKEDGSLAVEKPKPDLLRNLAYIVYGSIYQGITQEYVYNHLYPVFFGAGTDIRTVLIKVGFDLTIQTTLFTLPIAYLSKALIYRYSFREAFRRYFDDIRNHGLLIKYFALWGPVQCMTFSIIPEHFRIPFVAIVSFFWLIILSSIASKTPVMDDEECSLVDGQTCNIDG
jgi:protein Mpv17